MSLPILFLALSIPGYLSIREVARMLGVSERSVYGYIENGTLPGARIGNLIVVDAEAVQQFKRRAPGRIRTTTPYGMSHLCIISNM